MAPGRVVVVAEERKPDYFIGSTGRPVLTASLSHFTASAKKPMHPCRSGSGGRTEDDHRRGGGTRTTKLSKHLHNLTIRNGAPINGKAESDITTPPAIVNATGRRCSKSPPVSSGPAYDANGRRRMRSNSGGGWHTAPLSNEPKTGSRSLGGQRGQQHQQQHQPAVDRNRSLTSPAPRLLSIRARFNQPTDAPNSQPSLVLQQQCRYSNNHKQLDNRLGYQRSYDRNIFGYDQRMDQFVLPPLQI
uniref:Uncharacterized protein n=1 Tax=Anopheles farauti TaxID=69004 RepID=A0A182QVS6_9DIPT